MSKTNTRSIQSLWAHSKLFLQDRFNLDEDKASEQETIEEIKKGVVFRGTNLWVLMFAIMVASVGLNVNSPAVVIGAMLISPLMGPIMGVGLGVGINDFELIVKALRNLGIAVGISVLTSALYFWISPLNDAQSELLARTSPTLWDVLIALFGGLAGIVAGSRREKSNAIPGVAIATALMPPLCTAGYGLATGQWNFFFGAFYLFFINSVFISFSTYLIVRLLKFKPKEFVDPARETKVRRYILLFIFLTVIPSIITAYLVVSESLFERQANLFVQAELKFDNCQIISKQFYFSRKQKRIEVALYGEPVSTELIQRAEEQLPQYHLNDVVLLVRQGATPTDEGINVQTIEAMNMQMRAGIIEDLYKRNEEALKGKDDQIRLLEEEVLRLRSRDLPTAELATEMKAINSNLKELLVVQSYTAQVQDSMSTDTVYLAYTTWQQPIRRRERTQVEDWLKARLKTEKLRFVVQ